MNRMKPPIIIPDKDMPSREDIERSIEKVNKEIREKIEEQRKSAGLS